MQVSVENVKVKERQIFQESCFLKCLNLADTEDKTCLNNEPKYSEILSEDIATNFPTPGCLFYDENGK